MSTTPKQNRPPVEISNEELDLVYHDLNKVLKGRSLGAAALAFTYYMFREGQENSAEDFTFKGIQNNG